MKVCSGPNEAFVNASPSVSPMFVDAATGIISSGYVSHGAVLLALAFYFAAGIFFCKCKNKWINKRWSESET